MPIDAEKTIKELAAKGIRIPPQPSVLIELQKKYATDNFHINDLTRIISCDPGITAMLFKVVRSPVFASHKKFDSLEQVLMLIGIKQTCNLVRAIALCSSFNINTRKSLEQFWVRSRELAEIAALIASDRVSVCNIFPDQAYMAAIFHECGVPVLMQRFPDYCGKLHLDTTQGWPSLIAEDKLFNVDHCSIGYLVAHHWNLPDFVCKAILYHHEIPHEELGAVRTLVAILQLAIHCYHRINRASDPQWENLRLETLSELGIHLDDEGEYYDEITERFMA